MGYNLIEDEKEARKERAGMKLAIGILLMGAFFFYMSRKKRSNN